MERWLCPLAGYMHDADSSLSFFLSPSLSLSWHDILLMTTPPCRQGYCMKIVMLLIRLPILMYTTTLLSPVPRVLFPSFGFGTRSAFLHPPRFLYISRIIIPYLVPMHSPLVLMSLPFVPKMLAELNYLCCHKGKLNLTNMWYSACLVVTVYR
jgi:hypothetical protein